MAGLGISSFFETTERLSVKELEKLKRHIDHVIEKKRPGDRKVVGALDINDFVSMYPDFVLQPEIGSISDELLSSNPESKNTSSIWLSKTTLI